MATTKKQLVARIAEQTGSKRTLVKAVVQQFLDETIAELVKDNRLELREFGVFEARTRAARTGQNPKTLETVEVPARRTVKFKPGRLMTETPRLFESFLTCSSPTDTCLSALSQC